MGTRNLTMVIDQEGDKKIAQYGQWDGYPSGVGISVLEFLKNKELFENLKSNLSKVRFIDEDGVDKEFMDSYNKNTPERSSDPDNRTLEQIKWFQKYAHRDLAEEVLTNIANSEDEEILLLDREETAKGGGWVEYSYVINLQKNTLSVHTLVDQEPMKVFDLNNLPTEEVFLKELEEAEQD